MKGSQMCGGCIVRQLNHGRSHVEVVKWLMGLYVQRETSFNANLDFKNFFLENSPALAMHTFALALEGAKMADDPELQEMFRLALVGKAAEKAGWKPD